MTAGLPLPNGVDAKPAAKVSTLKNGLKVASIETFSPVSTVGLVVGMYCRHISFQYLLLVCTSGVYRFGTFYWYVPQAYIILILLFQVIVRLDSMISIRDTG